MIVDIVLILVVMFVGGRVRSPCRVPKIPLFYIFGIATSSCRCIADLVGKDAEVDRQARALGSPHQAIAALQAHVESIANAI